MKREKFCLELEPSASEESQIFTHRGPKTKTCKLPLSSRTNGADEKAGVSYQLPSSPLSKTFKNSTQVLGLDQDFGSFKRIGKRMGNHPVKHGLILGIPFFAEIL